MALPTITNPRFDDVLTSSFADQRDPETQAALEALIVEVDAEEDG